MATKEQFENKVEEMLREDAHWKGSGHNVSLIESEVRTFIEHVGKYFIEESSGYVEEELARALIATEGKFQSNQDRAKFIIKNLKPVQKK